MKKIQELIPLLSSRFFMMTLVLILAGQKISHAQNIGTKTGYISFYSEMEEVLAQNYAVESELDTSTGKIIFIACIQSFRFDNATMQKHFNEKDVMNSKEFPRAKFVGNMLNHDKIQYNQNGTYSVQVEGNLTMKGVTKEVKTKATIVVENGKISASAKFILDRFLFGVTDIADSISQMLDVEVKVNYE